MKFDHPNANVLDQAFLNARIPHDAANCANLQVQFMRRDTGLGEQGNIFTVEGGWEMVCYIFDFFYRITAEIGPWKKSVCEWVSRDREKITAQNPPAKPDKRFIINWLNLFTRRFNGLRKERWMDWLRFEKTWSGNNKSAASSMEWTWERYRKKTVMSKEGTPSPI